MIAFPEAQRAVIEVCAALEAESVALGDALGRVLAVDAIAEEALVPFARSAMDGYAVFSGDLVLLPRTLPVAAAVYAAPGTRLHVPGTATAIATGAALPAGADAVVPFEDASFADGSIRVEQPVEAGDAVFPPGDDALAGEVLVRRGDVVTAAALGILAAAGYARIAVHRRPVVTIVCSGDELVPVEARPGNGQIRNSNAPLLAAAIATFGGVVRQVTTVADDRERLTAALDEALRASDLVVTTGGASMGERDYVKAAATSLGVVFAFEQVALRPAKPTAFGRRGATVLAVLPGNPAAAFVALHEFVGPAIRALSGTAQPLPARIEVALDGSIHSKPGRHFAAFAELLATEAGLVARPLGNQCSSLTRTAAEACGFIVVPPGAAAYESGTRVAFDVVDWTKLRTVVLRAPARFSSQVGG
jgi:molybdopterin molybdotransferase